MDTPLKPSYVVATTLIDTCIFDVKTSDSGHLPKKLQLTECQRRLAHSRNFFKALREIYSPAAVSNVCLPYTEAIGAESKSQILQNARAFGYDNVTLCSFENAAAIRALRCANLDPEDGDVVILIFHQSDIIAASILQFRDDCWLPLKHSMVPVNVPRKELETFCYNLILNAPSTSKFHDYIVAYSYDLFVPRKQFFENIFKENLQFFDFGEKDSEGLSGLLSGFLTKARIIEGDKNLKKFDVAAVCDWDFKVVCDNDDLKSFKTCYKRLPFSESIKLDVQQGALFEFYKRHFIEKKWIFDSAFTVPPSASRAIKVELILEVDRNGISDFTVVECLTSDETKRSASSKKTTSVDVKPRMPDPLPSKSKNNTPLQFSKSVPAKRNPAEQNVEIHFLENTFVVYSVTGSEHKVIPNLKGNPSTPCFINFQKMQPTVGESAQEMLKEYPSYTVYDFLPLFGKKLSEVEINEEWPFKLLASHCGKFIDLEINTFRGIRRAPISSLMAILLLYTKKLVEKRLTTPLTEAKIVFSDQLGFSDMELMKQTMKEAEIKLIE